MGRSLLRRARIRPRRACASAGALVVAAGLATSCQPNAVPAAYPSANVPVIGHGWGHGYGYGQWGGLGYALQGYSYSWILDHYYGGTSMGTAPNNPIRVVITGNDGNLPIVTSQSAFTVGSTTFAAGQAALFAPASGGNWGVYQGPSCAGPWGSAVQTSASPVAMPSTTDPNATSSALMQICMAGGNEVLRGGIGPASYNGSDRTVNVLPLESYVRGVVPSESPAYWGTLGTSGSQGQPQGFQALESQAVAARSYAVANLGEFGYADMCDGPACQAYLGYKAETSQSNLAVDDTAGQVRVFASGGVASTMYSASTGGFTKGGDFTPVADTGDAVCVPSACNPNHTWTADIPVSQIEGVWPSIGSLSSITVSKRDGNGDFGGRATTVTITGSGGTVSVSGTDFEGTFGLDSDYFAFEGAASGGDNGYWLTSAAGGVYAYGSAGFFGSEATPSLSGQIVAMAVMPDRSGYWLASSDGTVYNFGDAGKYGNAAHHSGSAPVSPAGATSGIGTASGSGAPGSATPKAGTTTAPSNSHARPAPSTSHSPAPVPLTLPGGVSPAVTLSPSTLSSPIAGIAATVDGKGYWLVAADGTLYSFGDAANLGSPAGGPPLAKPIVAMCATPDGKGYWMVASDGGIFSYGDAGFFGSTGAIKLAQPINGITPTADAKGYWMVASDGGLFAFGDATYYGSLPGEGIASTAMGMATTASGKGYEIVTANGEVHAFGDAPLYGDLSTPDPGFAGTIVGIVLHSGS